MIVVDTSAVIAILRLETDADDFMRVIARADGCLMSAVSALEASMVLTGSVRGAGNWSRLDELIERSIEIVPFDAAQAVRAREAFLHYGKGRHPAGLNFGDCAAYALATLHAAPLLFKGTDFSKTDLMAAL